MPKTIKLGGKERSMRFTLGALRLIGEHLDLNIRLSHLQEDLMDKPLPLSAPGILLWAALKQDDPDLTLEQVEGWVDQDNFAEVMEGFFGLFGKTPPALVETVQGPEVPDAEAA